MSRLINDVTAIRMLLGVGILNLVNTPIYYAYGVAIMLTLDPPLTLVALLPFPLLLLMVKRISRRLMEQTLRVQEGLAGLSSAVQENISGIHVVKAYDAEAVAARRFARLNDEFTRQSVELARVRGRLMPLMKIASGAGTLMVLWYGGVAGHRRPPRPRRPGRLHRLPEPARLADHGAGLDAVDPAARPRRHAAPRAHLRHRRRRSPTPPDAEPLPAVRGRIEFRNVVLRLSAAATTATRWSSTSRSRSSRVRSWRWSAAPAPARARWCSCCRACSTSATARFCSTAATSAAAAGATARRHRLRAAGSVPLLDHDPRQHRLRRRCTPRTSVDGIVRRAAEIAGVAADLDAFPRGYDTVVGERGITLSGGQKQRLTLARAVAATPRVLVLDDALSSVDTRTEQRHPAAACATVMVGRTSIVIAHRVSTDHGRRLIAVLDEGRIVELGDHAALLARDGLYADLYRQQQLEEEIEAL